VRRVAPPQANIWSNREDQLKELRRIFTPDKEALGVLAIEIEKISGG
jgi:hypothetical protein